MFDYRKFPPSLVGAEPGVIAPFLNDLFSEFAERDVTWAVLHGGETLPYYTRRDIDFLFTRKQISLVKKLVLEVALRHGWVCYAEFHFSALHSLWFMLPAREGQPSAYLQLDCFVDTSLRGICFYRNGCATVLSQRYQNENGVWCLNVFDATALVVLKEVLANGRIERESRQSEIANVYRMSPDAFLKAMSAFRMTSTTAQKIVDRVGRCEWESFKDLAPRVKEEIYSPRLRDIPAIARYAFDLVKMFLCPFLRLHIVIIGPDGCGKTSVADAIHERFRFRPFYGFMCLHGNFGSLPRLRDIWKSVAHVVGKKVVYKKDPAPATRHMGMKPPLARFRSMLYIAYYGIEYWLGRLKLRKWRTFSGMVIADRYFCDYFYMRGHMNCPTWWKKLFEKLVPKPDLIFALERPAEDIYAQKPELTVEEIKREQNVIRSYLKGKKSARIVDASHGLEATVDAVAAEIEKWLLEKVR